MKFNKYGISIPIKPRLRSIIRSGQRVLVLDEMTVTPVHLRQFQQMLLDTEPVITNVQPRISY